MLEKEIAVKVDHVSKDFRLPTEATQSLRTALVNRFRGIKGYREQHVLKDISFDVYKGDFFGIVGRNGSGKTMLMKHILGFVSPTSGTITIDGKVLGKDIDAPDNIGAIIENPGFLPGYSGFRNLKMLASIRHKISDEEIKNAIRLVGLDPESKKHVGKYSLGMRQRLGLAQALMEHPDILLLDEPLSGLDNDGVQEMYQILLKQREEGKLIVVASHSSEDIRVLCDEIFHFDKGKMIDHQIAEK